MMLRATSKVLEETKRGPKHGDCSCLIIEQQQIIQKLLIDKTPDQLRFNFALWTSQSVALAIKEQFNITLADRSVRRYLAAWGYTPQRPIRRAYEQDNEAVKNGKPSNTRPLRKEQKRKKEKSIGAMKRAPKRAGTDPEDTHQKVRHRSSDQLRIKE